MLGNDIKFARLRCPNAKMGLVFADQFCANGVATLYFANLSFPAEHRSPTCERALTKQPRNGGFYICLAPQALFYFQPGAVSQDIEFPVNKR